jgi:hypothetical protein
LSLTLLAFASNDNLVLRGALILPAINLWFSLRLVSLFGVLNCHCFPFQKWFSLNVLLWFARIR